MNELSVEVEREDDGRWLGEVTELPGVLSYGATRDEAVAKTKALAFRVLADRLEHGEDIPEITAFFCKGFSAPPASPRETNQCGRTPLHVFDNRFFGTSGTSPA